MTSLLSDAVHGDDMASLSGDSAIGDGEEVPELQHLHVSTPSLYWSSGGGLKRFNSSLSVRASSVADLVQVGLDVLLLCIKRQAYCTSISRVLASWTFLIVSL